MSEATPSKSSKKAASAAEAESKEAATQAKAAAKKPEAKATASESAIGDQYAIVEASGTQIWLLSLIHI